MPADPKPNRLLIAAIILLAFALFLNVYVRGRVERTEKKEEKQTVKTGVATKATSATVKSKKIDTTGFTFDSRGKTKAKSKTENRTRNITRKRVTTTFDPSTGTPTSRVEEDLTVSDDTKKAEQTAATTTQKQTTAAQTQGTEHIAVLTEEQAIANKEKVNQLISESSQKPIEQKRPIVGLAGTTSKHTGITVDVARKGPFTAAGIVTIDLEHGEIAGVGAGINADVWRRGKYYVGVYGIRDIKNDSNKVVGAMGYRF